MAGLASINVKFKVDLSELSTQMQNAVRQIDRVGQRMQEVGRNMSAFVTLPVLAAGGAAVKMASDYEESVNKVDVAFKGSSGEVKGWAKTTIDSFGIAEGSALDMAALFGDMGSSMGLSRAEAAKMSTSLVGLAGDLASFKNIGIDEATTALNGIFTGETESLKRLGVVMTEANLAQFALNQGITKQIKNMSQAEKVQLRYNYVMEQTKNAQGDFARTSGGAANQTRTFGELLKEIGQSFGKIILPAYTKAITYVNELAKKFKDLSSETKTTIVVVAGLASAIGPLLFSIGALMSTVPLIVSGFATIKTAFLSLTTAIAANPLGAFLIALSAIASVLLVNSVRFRELTDASNEFNKINAQASDSIAKEKSQLEQYIEVAKNDKLSKEQRQDAIKKLNALSPEYLGNLTLENINTQAAKKATDGYVNALLLKAKVLAAQEKLVSVQKRLLDLQLGQLDAVKPSLWQELGNRILSAGNAGRYAALSMQTLGGNLTKEQQELVKLQALLTSFIQSNEKFAKSNDESANSVKQLNNQLIKGPQAGSIAFYENQIAALEKFRNEHNLSAAEYEKYADKIAEIQKNIDKIKDATPTVEAVDLSSIDKSSKTSAEQLKIQENEALIESYKELQKTQVEGSAKWLEYQGKIKSSTDEINKIKVSVGFEGIAEATESLNNFQTSTNEFYQNFTEQATEFNEGLAGIMQNTATSFTTGFGEILGQAMAGVSSMSGIFSLIVSAIADMAIQIGKLAIGIGISVAGIKKALTSLNPVVAIAAGVALVALGTFAKNALAKVADGGNAPRFEKGGIVGGNSYYGDKILARVNSGELILNQKQQSRLYGMINPADAPIVLNGGFQVSGDQLQLIIDRAGKRKGRIG
jgi:hypothetical protein